MLETEPRDRYLISPRQLQTALTPKTKLIVLITPSNPSSTAYTKAEIAALAPVLLRFQRVDSV